MTDHAHTGLEPSTPNAQTGVLDIIPSPVKLIKNDPASFPALPISRATFPGCQHPSRIFLNISCADPVLGPRHSEVAGRLPLLELHRWERRPASEGQSQLRGSLELALPGP